jgi:hypothetical protein
MIRSRLGLKALGMCALVLGLMAVWAGAAQAEEPGGSWTYVKEIIKEKNEKGEEVELLIDLKTFEGALAEPELEGEVDVTGVLHSEALENTKVLYECKKFEAVGGKLKPNGVALGKLKFTECVTFLGGALSPPCKPKGGSVTTNLIKAQMLLHKLAGGTVDKIIMAEGETEAGGAANFAVIESEGACALGTKGPVGGKFAIEPSNPTKHEVKHLIKEFPALTHLWILSDNAEHKSTILGSAWAFLKGAHAGLNFAGLWK